MAKEKEKNSYSVIIPSIVLHCNKLTKGAKLLYAEIANECKKSSYCRLTNSYFAKCLDVSETSISKWVSELKKNKFIKHSCKFIKHYNKNIRTMYVKTISKETIKAYIKVIDSIDQFPDWKPKWQGKEGWVYLLRYDKFFKIGITRQENPVNRIETYDLYNPFPKEIIFCKLVNNCIKIERQIKAKFSKKTATNSQE